jgi:hypothetical protein
MDRKIMLPLDLKETLIACLEEREEIVFAMLYGSAAEAEGAFNDVDIGLLVDETLVDVKKPLMYCFNLANELEKVVPYPVDVRVINQAPLGFRYNVSRGVPLVVNDEGVFYTFLERTWDTYFDYKPVMIKYLKDLV